MKPRQPFTYTQALNYALRLLNQRSYSEATLVQKLRHRLTEEGDIARILAKLKEMKLIDDKRYAEAVLRTESTYRHQSNQIITQKLRKKGINSTLIKGIMSQNNDEVEPEESRITYHLERYVRRTKEIDKQKLASYLYRKGFSGDLVHKAIRTYLHNSTNEI